MGSTDKVRLTNFFGTGLERGKGAVITNSRKSTCQQILETLRAMKVSGLTSDSGIIATCKRMSLKGDLYLTFGFWC